MQGSRLLEAGFHELVTSTGYIRRNVLRRYVPFFMPLEFTLSSRVEDVDASLLLLLCTCTHYLKVAQAAAYGRRQAGLVVNL